MSIKTWKEEFYPVDVKDINKDDAIEHSLKKWYGLKLENLEKHGCHRNCYASIVDEDGVEFKVDSFSCSLCHHYEDTGDENEGYCDPCPIVKATGYACDDPNKYSDNFSAWSMWTSENDPSRMIELLEETLKNS